MEAKDIKDLGSVLKMVILLEQEPLSDIFEQILLTQEQYIKLTQWLVDNKRPCPPPAHDESTCAGFTTSDRYKDIHLMDIPHIYTEEDFDNPLK